MARRAVAVVFLFTLVLGVVLSTRGAADGASDAAATLRVEHASLDLGEVVAGNDAVGRFVFHNDGDRDVRILRAKPS